MDTPEEYVNYLRSSLKDRDERIYELERERDKLAAENARLQQFYDSMYAKDCRDIADALLRAENAELRKALAGMLKEYRDLDLPYGSEAYRAGNAAMQSAGEHKNVLSHNFSRTDEPPERPSDEDCW